jgi:hypothetical protein
MLTATKKLFIALAGLMLISSAVYSQADSIPVRNDQVNKPVVEVASFVDLGIGFGLDYGGILGVQLGVTALKHLTFFGSGGYYKFQGGWNVGIKTLLIAKTSKHAGRPYLKIMYGCNSAIEVEGADEYNKVYKGWTAGLGIELRFGKKKQNGFDIDLNVPLRTGDFWVDFNDMKNDPNIDVIAEPIPITISIGFHHEF